MRLELAFGVQARMMLQMQPWFDTEASRARAGKLGVRRRLSELPPRGR